jgi:hypothetical protein
LQVKLKLELAQFAELKLSLNLPDLDEATQNN